MRILVRPSWLRRLRLLSWCQSQICQLYRRATGFCCQLVAVSDKDLWKLFIGLLTLLLLIGIGLFILLHDPCNTARIKEQMCQDYQQGLIAGNLCYDLCVTNSIYLPRCLSQDKDTLTFHWTKSVGKLSSSASFHSKSTSYSTDSRLPRHIFHLEGRINQDNLRNMISELIASKLGHVDLTVTMDKIYEFADFNQDGKLNFGEANSIWELLHSHEFFILFMFQGDSVFPVINSTCGSLFTYERTLVQKLFDNVNQGFLDNFFSHTYRWTFPQWEKRANIGVGLLEYITSLSETGNSQFYMCDIQPTKFGYTDHFETRLTAFEDITSQHNLEKIILGKKCRRDEDCTHGNHCVTICDISTRTCTGKMKYPILVHMCHVLKEYILFDAPDEVKVTLEILLTQCLQLHTQNYIGEDLAKLRNSQTMKHNLILHELTLLLWDQVKSKPVNWLDPPKVKKSRTK